jgi:hypothetical protein
MTTAAFFDIGDVAPGRAFELHAGFSPSAAVEQRSVELAGRGQLRPRHLPGRHGRRVAQRHPLSTWSPTSSRSRNAASSAVKASGLSWLLACPALGIVT